MEESTIGLKLKEWGEAKKNKIILFKIKNIQLEIICLIEFRILYFIVTHTFMSTCIHTPTNAYPHYPPNCAYAKESFSNILKILICISALQIHREGEWGSQSPQEGEISSVIRHRLSNWIKPGHCATDHWHSPSWVPITSFLISRKKKEIAELRLKVDFYLNLYSLRGHICRLKNLSNRVYIASAKYIVTM